MSQTKHTAAGMIGAVKQMEAGRTAEEIGREIGVSKHAVYAWKSRYGGMEVPQAEELKRLQEYDAAGNLTRDTSHSYQYDAENRLLSVDSGATASYLYDAEGRRVHAAVGGAVREYVYGMGSRRVTVVDGGQNLVGAETSFGERYLGTETPSGFIWAFSLRPIHALFEWDSFPRPRRRELRAARRGRSV